MEKKLAIIESDRVASGELKSMAERAGYIVCGIAHSSDEGLAMVFDRNPSLVLIDIHVQGNLTAIALAGKLIQKNIAFIYISSCPDPIIKEAIKTTNPCGFLIRPFREQDLYIILDIAKCKIEDEEATQTHRTNILRCQLEHVASSPETRDFKINMLLSALRKVIKFDFFALHPEKNRVDLKNEFYMSKSPDYSYHFQNGEELLSVLETSQQDFKRLNFATTAPETMIFAGQNFSNLKLDNRWIRLLSDHFSLECAMSYTVKLTLGNSYVLTFYSIHEFNYCDWQLEMLKALDEHLGVAIKQIFSSKASSPVPVEIKNDISFVNPIRDNPFNGIVGESAPLHKVLEQIKILAPAETTALIMGESGTGKEKIAHAIHNLSERRNKPIITVNCAALPANLIESELFGYEKGAFTGANERRIGKFEQAEGGTLFLDEIGELPLESQVKILRVLQEKEIERLGGGNTIKVNVRIMAATNRNLEKEVNEGRFRIDLYYRLNTFPISLPALRERKEDIIVLANHFIQKYAALLNKEVDSLSPDVLAQLMNYGWPGNIRELEHLMERSVLLATDRQIATVDLPQSNGASVLKKEEKNLLITMEEMERDYIVEVLSACNWKVSGQSNAAEILGMPISTLYSRMMKLGIKKDCPAMPYNITKPERDYLVI